MRGDRGRDSAFWVNVDRCPATLFSSPTGRTLEHHIEIRQIELNVRPTSCRFSAMYPELLEPPERFDWQRGSIRGGEVQEREALAQSKVGYASASQPTYVPTSSISCGAQHHLHQLSCIRNYSWTPSQWALAIGPGIFVMGCKSRDS